MTSHHRSVQVESAGAWVSLQKEATPDGPILKATRRSPIIGPDTLPLQTPSWLLASPNDPEMGRTQSGITHSEARIMSTTGVPTKETPGLSQNGYGGFCGCSGCGGCGADG